MVKITNLPTLATLDNGDFLAIVDSSGNITAKISRADLFAMLQLPAGTVLPNASVTSSNIDFTTSGGIWWEELGRITGGSGNSVILSDLPTRRNLQLLIYANKSSTSGSFTITCNSDTGNNYATRVSSNGGSDATATSGPSATVVSGTTDTQVFMSFNIRNVANLPKIFIGNSASDVPGAGNAPNRQERVLKWNNVVAQISSITLDCSQPMTDVNIIVLGHD